MSRLALAVEAQRNLEWLDRVLLGKATPLPSILTEPGFVRALLREANLIKKQVRGSLSTILARVRRSTSLDWPKSTAAQRTAAVAELGNLLSGLPSKFSPGVKLVLDDQGRRVLRDTNRALGKRHKRIEIDSSFALKNQAAVDALSSTTSMFFSSEYARRARRFRPRAQDVITRGLDQGLGRREIATELQREFARTGIAEHYWETVAAVHVQRARSFSCAASFRDAGITRYEVVAVRDERTTAICIEMDGKKFSVAAALSAFNRLERARSLAAVQRAAPFLSEVSGDVVLPDGTAVDTLTNDQLNAAGVNMPPYHFRCRTTVVPIL